MHPRTYAATKVIPGTPSKQTSSKQCSVAFHTLGCRLNQYETDSIASELKQRGFAIVESNKKADVHIVNTCTVTKKAARKSRNIMNRAKALSDRLTVFTGCFATEEKEKLKDTDKSLVVDNDRKSRIADIVSSYVSGEMIDPNALKPELFDYTSQSSPFHTRPLIKIQDGCDNFCTFCIIPSVRGRAKSRPPQEILDHIRAAVDQGAREIILTGVNITRYQYDAWDFNALFESILETEGEFRVRLSSIEPEIDVTRMQEFAKHKKFCPHLHLCLQSGSNRMLLQMRREYTVKDYVHIAESMRKVDPLFNITTDVIVGFPGETEKDFNETIRITKLLEFGHIHVFPYSSRSGTRAERLQPHISPSIKQTRSKELMNISLELTRMVRSRFLERETNVLTEELKPQKTESYTYGLNEYYIPTLIRGAHETNAIIPVASKRLFPSGELDARAISR